MTKPTKERAGGTGSDVFADGNRIQTKEKVFTDDEIIDLEQDIIETYIMSSEKPVKILLRMYRKYIKDIILSLIFYLLKTLPVLVLPVITAKIINLVAQRPEDFFRHIAIYAAIMMFLTVMNIPTCIAQYRFYSIVARKVEAGLRGAMIKKLQQLSMTFHKEMQSGRIQSKLMRDVETIQGLSSQLFTTLPGIAINALTALVVVVSNNLTVFCFFLLCIPSSILTVRAFSRPIKRSNAAFRHDTENTSANVMDMVEMTQITRAHALEHREIKKMTGILGHMASTGYRLDMVTSVFGSTSWVMFQIFQFGCLLFSAYLAYKEKISIGDISLYQSYFTMLTGQVSTIIGLMPIIAKGFDSISSVGDILCAEDIEANEGKTVLPELRGEYEFRDVSFRYEDNMPLLQGIDLHIRQGETIAFVGESGSGKTTLMNLLIGFNMPQNGVLTVDGEDITRIDLRSYRRFISVVPQNSVMFTGTIRENVTYGMENVTEKQLADALEAAKLTEFINSLPEGVDTPLEEHGANLSGGQRQRLSIARALIRDPSVILLDEATSALDSISEKQIQDAINNLTSGRTTFIVAHRLSTIKSADRIAVIKNGRCVECGNYEELMEKKGEFYALRSMQQI
ncbi:MAG: ABC transporter ATP-binding protein [Clostridia bacterium]|nr:ABC transporter ATP-binding protein [Clostridia bacterium]